jgi:myo-inositol 2-dehydrogenase/D-chiro-inositol 1-dehydrogenase
MGAPQHRAQRAMTDGSRTATVTPLRIGLVGAGGIAPSHVEAWHHDDAEIMVHSLGGATDLADRYGVKAAKDLHSVLQWADAVDIVTPTATHGDLALAAVAAGVHVVCEKPLAATSQEARRMVAAAAAAGLIIYPAHVVRYFPEYAAIKAAVDVGRIGIPAVLRLSRAGQAPRPDSWFYDENAGGGIILDQMVHDLDQARWMLGEVTQVYAVQNPPTVEGRVPPVVTAHVVLTHSSGAISHVEGYWGPPGLTFRTSVHIAGSRGTLDYRSADDGAWSMDAPGPAASDGYLPPQTHAVSPFDREIGEFADAMRGGPSPRVSAGDGVMAVALAEAAITSVRTGQAVPFDAEAVGNGSIPSGVTA